MKYINNKMRKIFLSIFVMALTVMALGMDDGEITGLTVGIC